VYGNCKLENEVKDCTNICHTMSEIKGQENGRDFVSFLWITKWNRQNHTPNGRVHKSSSPSFIEQVSTYIISVLNVSQLIQSQVRTCLQERTSFNLHHFSLKCFTVTQFHSLKLQHVYKKEQTQTTCNGTKNKLLAMEWKRNTYVCNVTFQTLCTNDTLNQYTDFI
jgi:hypothetical protein